MSDGVTDMHREIARAHEIKHPDHYTWIPGIECMDVVKHFKFAVGAAIKYLWRCERKGTKLQDLKKAKQMIDFEIEEIENGFRSDLYATTEIGPDTRRDK